MGNDLGAINVTSVDEAQAACTRLIECRGFCYEGNETFNTVTKVTTEFQRVNRIALDLRAMGCWHTLRQQGFGLRFTSNR